MVGVILIVERFGDILMYNILEFSGYIVCYNEQKLEELCGKEHVHYVAINNNKYLINSSVDVNEAFLEKLSSICESLNLTCVDTDYCYSKYTKDGFDKMYVVDAFTLTNTINSMYDVNFTEQEIKSALYESEQY